MIYAVILIVLISLVIIVYRHQCLLRDRAHLMREAIRNKEFTFRLPTKGLMFGERAMQLALNDLGQDISKLVAQNEVESWQRLTRVLTHEIMNATTPIQSISQAYLKSDKIKGTIYEEGIKAIHDTSVGLASFVDSYRNMTNMQEPVLKEVNVSKSIKTIQSLYPTVNWKIEIPSEQTWNVDENLMRQVLINIVKNATEANAKTIDIRWNGKLTISNDGNPIPADVRRDIFIPFFTTKQTGSGIGLSLSRQILMKMGMDLSLFYNPITGYHTTFCIE